LLSPSSAALDKLQLLHRMAAQISGRALRNAKATDAAVVAWQF
jgi:hypothetical protein